VKIHCSVLAEDAIKAAIADFRAKQARKKAELAAPAHAEGEPANV
jgi:nitrogen fixation protein NifU and related proteins